MKPVKPLSISGYNTYMECPAKFELHYIQKLRPIVQPSYFVFGSAVDSGLNALLKPSDIDPYEAAAKELERLKNEIVEFLPTDYDGEIIEDKAELLKQIQALGYKGDDVDGLVQALQAKPFSSLSEMQRKALALCNYESLRVKARLMIDAYRKRILPLINETTDVQKELRWVDDKGNAFVGVVDGIFDIKGQGILIGDNKTSGNPRRDYAPDSVRSSFQLGMYSKVEGIKKAAYFVMGKQLKKNRVKTCSVCGNDGTGKRHKTCDAIVPASIQGLNPPSDVRCNGEWTETIKPEVEIHIVIDDLSPQEQELGQKALTNVAESIKAGCFPQNLKSCRQKFGPRESVCPYYNYCRNGSTEGLIKKVDDEKK